MQPLNHDIDDLMRKAAEGYPVRPQGADWEKVAQELDASDNHIAAARYGHLKKLLLLLTFILASFVCDRFLSYEYGHLKKYELPGPINNQVKGSKDLIKSERPERNEQPPARLLTKTKVRNLQKSGSVASPVFKNGQATNRAPIAAMGILKSYGDAVSYNYTNYHASASAPFVESKKLVPITVAKNIQRITIAAEPTTGKDKNTNAKKTKDKPIEKAFITVLAGPDFSRVKAQKTDAAGYNLGIMAGYNFNKRWAVEVGVFWDRKNYFSKGAYFKADHLYLPQHSKVVQVDGFCKMFEFPVLVRFNALQKRGATLFAAAGVASYLMQKEDYDYVYQRYDENYSGNKKYKAASKDWLSMANVSVGYEHRLGSKIKIHIEPYFKIPLKGVGIGALPLSSTGVLVGITHPIR